MRFGIVYLRSPLNGAVGPLLSPGDVLAKAVVVVHQPLCDYSGMHLYDWVNKFGASEVHYFDGAVTGAVPYGIYC